MNQHNNKYYITKTLKLILSIGFAIALSACSNDDEKAESTETVAEMPEFIQAISLLTKDTGMLQAWITIDGGTRKKMTLEGKTVKATINDLTISKHNLLIEFEYTDGTDEGTVTLAILDKQIDLTNGDREFTFGDNEYIKSNNDERAVEFNSPFNDDGDKFSNLDEILNNTDPTDSLSFPPYSECTLQDLNDNIEDSKINQCTLG